jgi:hypothetical protein
MGSRGSEASRGSGGSSGSGGGGSLGSVTHGRESHIVNRAADERDTDESEAALPADDATLKTKI